MGNVTILIAAGIIGFLLVYLMFKIDEKKHFILQLLMLMFLLTILIVIGKIAVDDSDNCTWNIVNSTTSGSLTQYDYEYQCSTNQYNTDVIFFRVILGIVLLFFIYILVYFGKYSLEWLQNSFNRK